MSARRLQLWILVSGSVALAAATGIFLASSDEPSRDPQGGKRPNPTRPTVPVERSYAGSASCRECHAGQYELWASSHHALAERTLDFERDRKAFEPARDVSFGGIRSSLRERDGRLEIVTQGRDGGSSPHVPERIIGTTPLIQFLVPGERGRLQVASLSFDPKENEWFDVFGEEDRRAGEWGHWTGRGMTWNSMCASCHMTHLRKGYDARADAYTTTWKEMGVGCEACHGPYAEHVAWYRSERKSEPWPEKPVRTPDTILDTCGACHARRSELTEGYIAGERFTEHFRPVLPDEPEIYYADGQVLGENYVYTSFLSSRMHGEGVRCTHCHEPHGARLRLEGNALCLSCHKGKIDPASHSHHDVTKPGGQCVNCHMPETTYMQRDPRRDHGFTIPDPLLTKELGIPNACNRCHTDRSTEWAIEATEKWYGKRMERNTRARARTVARGQRGDPDAIAQLAAMVDEEKSPVWRTVAVNLLAPWIHLEPVRGRFVEWLGDPEPLVRAAVTRSFDLLPEGAARVAHLAGDTSRLVRLEAAWVLRRRLDMSSKAGKELAAHLDQIADQPTGAMQRGYFYSERGDVPRARQWFAKAVAWDPNSAGIREAYAVLLSGTGDHAGAVDQLAAARKLEPESAGIAMSYGLALAEAGRIDDARRELEAACALDSTFARAWYNLGLLLNEVGDEDRALTALARAEKEDPQVPEYPYARATILLRIGDLPAAREAATRAAEIAPGYVDAERLIGVIDAQMNPRR